MEKLCLHGTGMCEMISGGVLLHEDFTYRAAAHLYIEAGCGSSHLHTLQIEVNGGSVSVIFNAGDA